ncbi:nitrogen specific signal transduction histidine kinase NtrB [Natrialba hulunbeirensis JCM 10989]|uniref:Nitrogen specific signal transduction histidine kinase NtrB n=1 Tax=Natrialba hulunbeirensis JCM 10989 TaxID=1227493 RepID=L9ZWY9_9EURY|nr:GAF domain-containing protein [Natrialba hulunbeirensis]ELY90566.1 nitrogen specific signal transduction histidine kinase NtrB [Natrialba hulunbeirensis JCM 10989]
MGTGTPRHRPQTILYVAASEDAARDGAAALQRVPSGPDRAVRPMTAVERVESWAANVDCVVFAETPTTPDGAHLLEVADACGETPLVLFSESGYGATAARSTDGIDGYVRRDTDDAISHLADELTWLCYGNDSGSTETSADSVEQRDGDNSETDTGTDTDTDTAIVATGKTDSGTDTDTDTNTNTNTEPPTTATTATTHNSTDTPLAGITNLLSCRDRDRLLESLVSLTATSLDNAECWISTVNFGELVAQTTAEGVDADAIDAMPTDGPVGTAFRAGESYVVPDIAAAEDVEPPLPDVRSLCSVPIDDLGVLVAASETPERFGSESGSENEDENGNRNRNANRNRNRNRNEAHSDRDERTDTDTDETDTTTTPTTVDQLEFRCEIVAAVLERNRAEARLAAERDQLETARDEIASERDRLAEEQTVIGEAAEQLAAERDRFRAAFAAAPLPALQYELEAESDPNGDGEAVITDVNAAFEATFGDNRETLCGRSVEEYTIPSGLSERATALTNALHAGEQRVLECRRETVAGVREFEVTVVPLASDSGTQQPTEERTSASAQTGLLYYVDRTEQSETERELTATRRRLDAIATLLEDEVQTPLNVARGYLELVEKTGDAEHFEVIDDAHLQLTDHVESLYDLAASDDVLAETEPVAIHDVARRAWITVDTGTAELVTESTLVLEADRTRLRELFELVLRLVLADGAGLDHAGNGPTPSARVTVGATDDGFYVARDGPSATSAGDDSVRGARGERKEDSSVADETAAAANADAQSASASVSTPPSTETEPQLAASAETEAEAAGDLDGARERVEQIADAHGWDVGIAADDERSAFAFRGIDSVEL